MKKRDRGKKREITKVFTLGGFNETRAIGSAEDTPLVYFRNFADDRGYALMSGDTHVGDVLAFVEKGSLDPQEGTDNPGLAIFSESMGKKRPVYMSGYATKRTIPNSTLNIATNNVEYTNGHAWIIDSDLTQKRNIYTYRYDGVLLKTEYETRSLVHCNWGWYGDADGYYFGNALKPAGGLVIGEKPPYGMGTVHYRYVLKAIPNIYL